MLPDLVRMLYEAQSPLSSHHYLTGHPSEFIRAGRSNLPAMPGGKEQARAKRMDYMISGGEIKSHTLLCLSQVASLGAK